MKLSKLALSFLLLTFSSLFLLKAVDLLSTAQAQTEDCTSTCDSPLCGQDDGCGGTCADSSDSWSCTCQYTEPDGDNVSWECSTGSSVECPTECEQDVTRTCSNPCAEAGYDTDEPDPSGTVTCSDDDDSWECSCEYDCPEEETWTCGVYWENCPVKCGQSGEKTCSNTCDEVGYSTDISDPSGGFTCSNSDDDWECSNWETDYSGDPDADCDPACGQTLTRNCTNPCEGCAQDDPQPSETNICSDCDEGIPERPNNLRPGTTDPDNPEQYWIDEVLNPESVRGTLWVDDGDATRVCDDEKWPRTDHFNIWVEDITANKTVASGEVADITDNSGQTGSFSVDGEPGHTYKWWAKAKNTDCGTFTSGSSAAVYYCRPDCYPALCGQNNFCGTACSSDHNGNPSPPSELRVGMENNRELAFSASKDANDPLVIDTTEDNTQVYLFWDLPSPESRDPEDEVRLEIWDLGDPVDEETDIDSFDWGEEPDRKKNITVGDWCSGNSCSYGALNINYHHVYAWRVAAHNVTCEEIDRSDNVGTSGGEMDPSALDSDCPNDDLCIGDGHRDWSDWNHGYFILDAFPEVQEMFPTTQMRGGYGGSGFVGDNPENHYNAGYGDPVWEWEDDWVQPWASPSYCDSAGCVDMTLQNNPEVFVVEVSDPDGWQDISRINFTVTAPGESCGEATDANLGWLSLARDSYDSSCASEECDVSFGSDGANEWTFLAGKVEKIDEHTLKAFFKIRFERAGFYDSSAGKIHLCAEGDDFHYADMETTWQGEDNWDWKVDMFSPEIDIAENNPMDGYEITDLKQINVDGEDIWVFEVEVQLVDHPLGPGSSDLYVDPDPRKLAEDTTGDGFITFKDRTSQTEEGEYSALAWYWGDPDGDGYWDWVRLSDDPDDPLKPFYYTVEWMD